MYWVSSRSLPWIVLSATLSLKMNTWGTCRSLNTLASLFAWSMLMKTQSTFSLPYLGFSRFSSSCVVSLINSPESFSMHNFPTWSHKLDVITRILQPKSRRHSSYLRSRISHFIFISFPSCTNFWVVRWFSSSIQHIFYWSMTVISSSFLTSTKG